MVVAVLSKFVVLPVQRLLRERHVVAGGGYWCGRVFCRSGCGHVFSWGALNHRVAEARRQPAELGPRELRGVLPSPLLIVAFLIQRPVLLQQRQHSSNNRTRFPCWQEKDQSRLARSQSALDAPAHEGSSICASRSASKRARSELTRTPIRGHARMRIQPSAPDCSPRSWSMRTFGPNSRTAYSGTCKRPGELEVLERWDKRLTSVASRRNGLVVTCLEK